MNLTDQATATAPSEAAVPPSRFVEVEGLSFAYPGASEPALRDVELSVAAGEFVCILGPSGCGKSTLLNIISQLAEPQRGTVRIGGDLIVGGKRDRNAQETAIGYVFQDARLLPWRTVRQNIELVLKAGGVPNGEWDARIDRYLRLCDIAQFADSWPNNLSGGQRQRVAIARALAIEPSLVLMDEPFSTLDEVTARFLRGELLEIWTRTKRTIIFITHSIREAVFLADRIFVMSAGPGTVIDDITVPVARPRRYEDPALTEFEGGIVTSVLAHWGYEDRVGA
jgi:ABC-type nitrate/sulfonate/bicarbonate transport system ATPase subunit